MAFNSAAKKLLRINDFSNYHVTNYRGLTVYAYLVVVDVGIQRHTSEAQALLSYSRHRSLYNLANFVAQFFI